MRGLCNAPHHAPGPDLVPSICLLLLRLGICPFPPRRRRPSAMPPCSCPRPDNTDPAARSNCALQHAAMPQGGGTRRVGPGGITSSIGRWSPRLPNGGYIVIYAYSSPPPSPRLIQANLSPDRPRRTHQTYVRSRPQKARDRSITKQVLENTWYSQEATDVIVHRRQSVEGGQGFPQPISPFA